MNETYDSFTRHRLQQYGKPDVDSLENLAVAIIVDQKRIAGNVRSTVGTVTDIYSLLRLLFSRIGTPFVGYSTVFSFAHSSVKCNTVTSVGKKLHREFYSLVFRACHLYVAVVFGRTHCFMPHRYTHSVQRYLFCRTSKDLFDELV